MFRHFILLPLVLVALGDDVCLRTLSITHVLTSECMWNVSVAEERENTSRCVRCALVEKRKEERLSHTRRPQKSFCSPCKRFLSVCVSFAVVRA